MDTGNEKFVVEQRIRTKINCTFSTHSPEENTLPMLKRQLSIPEQCPPALKRSFSSSGEDRSTSRQHKKRVENNKLIVSDSGIKAGR